MSKNGDKLKRMFKKNWLTDNLVPDSIHNQSRNNSIFIKYQSYTYTQKSVSFCAFMCWWCCRSQESSWITSLALCALCWTLLSSGACPDSSIRDKAFCTVVSLAPPRSPSKYCSSTRNLSSGIWGLCINHIVMIFFTLKFSVKGSQFMFNAASTLPFQTQRYAAVTTSV